MLKVVGSSVSINLFVVIIFLFVGGMIWGVFGLILVFFFVVVFKVVMEYIVLLQFVSELLSSDVYSDVGKFLNEYDYVWYCIFNYFNWKYKF